MSGPGFFGVLLLMLTFRLLLSPNNKTIFRKVEAQQDMAITAGAGTAVL